MKGLVIKTNGIYYQVKTEDRSIIPSQLKGNFRLQGIQSTNPVAVGDWVQIEKTSDGMAFICAIEERKNHLSRRASNFSKASHILAANLDQIFLIVTMNYPITTTLFMDRFLVAAEAYRIPTFLFFNKIDRYTFSEKKASDLLVRMYERIGYTCYKIATLEHFLPLMEMEKLLKGKTTLFSGHSGVGKSTLINQLLSQPSQRVKLISEYHNKGKHITTFSEMLELPYGGYVIDTPGIKGFGVSDLETEEISHCFPEIFRASHSCKFNNCTHKNEPKCAVKKAVECQSIGRSRYLSYLNLLTDQDKKYRKAF